MILIADSHISIKNNNVDDFFQMLQKVEETEHDIIFLGDIFDLWISIPRYQTEPQLKFLDWCSKEKNNRIVGFIEGNRDFFVQKYNEKHFSWVEKNSRTIEINNKKIFLCHGDAINVNDKQYQILRKVTKSMFIEFLFKFLPFGPSLANKLKDLMKDTNLRNKKKFPEKIVKDFADSIFKEDINVIVTGHFHRKYEYIKSDNANLFVLNDWWSSSEIVMINHNGIVEPINLSY